MMTTDTPRETMRDRFYRTAAELLDEDERVAVVVAEIGKTQLTDLGVFERHPDRALNVGIREQLMISVGAGMALEGMRPILHSYAPFLVERAFEQVKLDFSHQEVDGVLVSIGASYDAASEGRTHQSPADVAAIATMPGWTIYVPGHRDEVEATIRAAVGRDERAYIRLAEQTNAVPYAGARRELFRVRAGSEGAPTVLAVGPMLDRVLEALADEDATVLYTARARPFDAQSFRSLMTGSDIALVEPYFEGTSVAEVAAATSDRLTRIRAIGVPAEEHRHYGTYEDYDRAFGLDVPGLRARLFSFFAESTGASAGA